MALTLEKLLAPVDDDNPVGPDLSYSHERQEIERAFETDEGSQSEERDWRTILRLIEEQAGQTKDVWLPVYACRAGASSGSLETVAIGAQALAGLFEQYWDTVHPQLEELGVMGRKAPCDSLATRGGFLLPLERTVLVAHPRLGRFTGVDLQRFATERESAEGYGMFRAALEEGGDALLEGAIGQLDAIEDGLKRADKAFMQGAGGEPSPNYQPTFSLLTALRQAVKQFMTAPAEEPEEAWDGETGPGGGGGGGGKAAGPRISGRVDNREDVLKSLDLIADYYRRSEPSHPLQMLVERAREWVDMDFLTLMREIAPDSIRQARELLKKREEEY
ncbi:MAG TPA: type VI secretion system protein TssA [Caulobacteraceae bacterium]|jgi:type VI secretion system protein ImpA